MLQNTHQQHILVTNPSPSILRKVNTSLPPSSTPPRYASSSPSSTTPTSSNNTRVLNSSMTPPSLPRGTHLPSPPTNPNILLPENTKINNIIVKRKRKRRSKNFDTVTTPSPTRYVYPQPTFPTYYPIPQIPVHPIPPLPMGIKGIYSHPYSTNYYPTHPNQLQQQQPPQQPIRQQQQQKSTHYLNNTQVLTIPNESQILLANEEVLAEGNCIIEDGNSSFNNSDIYIGELQSENSGQKRRNIVTRLRHIVNKTDEYLTKSRLKEIANKEREEVQEILAYYKDDSPKTIPDTALLTENMDKKKILDLEFSQLLSITRSAFSHLAREYSKIGIDTSINRFVKPEKSSESTIPNLLSDTSHFFSLVQSITEANNTNMEVPQQDQMGSTVLNVLKSMESVLLDDTDTRITLSNPSTTVYHIEDDHEDYYEEIIPQYLFFNNSNKETDILNISAAENLDTSLSLVEKSDFAQQAETNCSSITIQTDDKSVEEISLQTSPIESSSVDIQTEETEVQRTSIDIQTEEEQVPIEVQRTSIEIQTDLLNFSPKKQTVTIDIQTDNTERISISTMTDELPIEKTDNSTQTSNKVIEEEETNSKKRKKDESSSSSSSESSEEEEEVKPKRKLRKRTAIATTTTKKKQAEPVYFVEKVVKHDNIDGKHWFYVKWQGFSSKFNSWVEEHDIIDKSLIRKYIKK